MFRMAALVDYLEIRLMAAHDADQHVCLVLFTKVSAETALSVANCFHISSCGRWGILIAFMNNDSMSFILCKLRPNQPPISATLSVGNVKQHKTGGLLDGRC